MPISSAMLCVFSTYIAGFGWEKKTDNLNFVIKTVRFTNKNWR